MSSLARSAARLAARAPRRAPQRALHPGAAHSAARPPPASPLPRRAQPARALSQRSLDFALQLDDDTICGLSSGAGRAGVAVLRLSGPHAADALRAVTRRRAPMEPRRLERVDVVSPRDGELLDSPALAALFPGPRSFTGEDVAELHVHGNPALVRRVLRELCALEGVRLAEAGEFTRRAFARGKLDLTQVEGLADLLQAETEQQLRQALRQSRGELGRLYEGWREELVRCLAHIEAVLDFADDEADVRDAEILKNVVPRVAALSERVRAYLADGRRGEMLRDGLQVAIVGRPNAGKSSLLNLLARRDVAIVSDVPGTTRDVLEVPLNLGGLPVVLADTAGLRDSADPVEREGIARARQRRDAADVVVAVCDAAAPDAIDSVAELAGAATGSSLVVVFNKLDALRAALPEALRARPRADLERELVARLRAPPLAACLLSCRSGEGVPELVATLQRVAEQRFEGAAGGTAPLITRERHRQLVGECAAMLDEFSRHLRERRDLDLAAESLRLAARALGRVVGRVDVEDLLDVIFRDFCIGK